MVIKYTLQVDVLSVPSHAVTNTIGDNVFENRKYVIISKDDVSSVDFSQVFETSADTLLYNNDKSKTIVKYDGSQPSFLSGKTEYSHSEILAILRDTDGEWYTEI